MQTEECHVGDFLSLGLNKRVLWESSGGGAEEIK
jgi:hypothetical protein